MNFKPFKISLLSVLILCVVAAFTVSCGDDDDVDCDKIYDDIEEAFEEYDDAYFDGDCEELDDLFDAAIKKLRQGKNCENVKDELDDAGYDNVEELIDELEEDHEDNVADCGAPA